MMNDARFYVQRIHGNQPEKLHMSFDSALTEAKRLAVKHPDATFHVIQLKVICKYNPHPIPPPTFRNS